jgi:hypothetical protein
VTTVTNLETTRILGNVGRGRGVRKGKNFLGRPGFTFGSI